MSDTLSTESTQPLVHPSIIRARIDHLDPAAVQSLGAAHELIKKATTDKEKESMAKKRARKIVVAADRVIAVVEGVAEINGFAKAAVSIFKGLIKMELDRANNSMQIAVLCHSMTVMMYTLRYLAPILHVSDDLSDQLSDELKSISDLMEEFGNFSNVFYKYKQDIFRLFRILEYKDKLNGFNESFNQAKDNLHEIINARVTLATYETREEVKKVIDLIGNMSTKQEQNAALYIKQHGGASTVLHDDILLAKVASILGDNLNLPLKSALRENLNELLSQNHQQFLLKLEGTQLQIEEAIARSRDAILRQLNEGPHDLVEDEDLKEIWKVNSWKNSVKARVFVDTLHNHYDAKFQKHKQENNGIDHPDAWTLAYLSKVQYHPAIGDAIDEDGSGFVSVLEMNHFLKKRPEKWSVPQWLTFWAAGWSYDNIRYLFTDISPTIEEIQEILKPHGKGTTGVHADYLERLDFVQDIILESLYYGVLDNSDDYGDDSDDLQQLQDEFMQSEKEGIVAKLEKVDYAIEDIQGVIAIAGQERVELFIMPLLSVVLDHDLKIAKKGRGHIDEYTLRKMTVTIEFICWAFHIRGLDLIRGWRRQRMNVALQTECFAGGLFDGWYSEYKSKSRAIKDLKRIITGEDDDDDDDDNTSADKMEQVLSRVTSMEDRIVSLESKLDTIETLLRSAFPGHKDGLKSQPATHNKGNRDIGTRSGQINEEHGGFVPNAGAYEEVAGKSVRNEGTEGSDNENEQEAKEEAEEEPGDKPEDQGDQDEGSEGSGGNNEDELEDEPEDRGDQDEGSEGSGGGYDAEDD